MLTVILQNIFEFRLLMYKKRLHGTDEYNPSRDG
jgi:hypothetical protein